MPAALEKCVSDLKKDPDFKPKDGKTKEESAYAVCTEAMKKAGKMSDEEFRIFLSADYQGAGPTLLGAALTNRPFMVLPPVEWRGEGDERQLRVPLFTRGKFSHPKFGVLTFDDDFFTRLEKNFNAGTAGIDPSIDLRHDPNFGAAGWFTKTWREGDLFGVMARPTPKGSVLVDEQSYRYASAEFAFDFKGNRVSMSMDDKELEVYDEDAEGAKLADLARELSMDKEANMPDPNDKGPETGTPPQIDLEAMQATILERVNAEYKDKIAALEGRAATLEQENVRLARVAYEAEVATIIAQAENRRDTDGRAHSPVLLEACKKALLGEAVADGAVKLEAGTNDGSYLRSFVTYLLENLPGTMAASAKLEGGGSEVNPHAGEQEGMTEKEKGLFDLLPKPPKKEGDE